MYSMKLLLCASVAATTFAGAAAAQTSPSAAPQPTALDELVVTASRREERLQDVAMVVSAYSGEQIAKAQVTSGKDLVRLTPGLSLAAPSGDSGNIVFSLRGVSLNDYGVGNEAPVAVYADDVYQSSLSSGTALTFDLDRVEVLKGPQGTLFGRNATGGLVHFISARPRHEFGGYVDARAGSYGYSAEAAINVPVTSELATRLALSSEHVDGWMNNSLGKDGNNANKAAARFQALYDAGSYSALLILRGNVAYSRPQYTFQATDPGADGLGVAVDKPANEALGVPPSPLFRPLDDHDPYTGAVNEAGHSRRKNYGATLRLEGRLNDIELVSITDATRNTTEFIEDSDMSPAKLYELPSDSKLTQYSQEFRASRQGQRLKWVGGVYLFHSKVTNPRGFALYPFGVAYDSRMAQNTSSAAAFGEATYQLNDTLTVVAGVRYTTEKRRIDFKQDLLVDVDGSGLGSPTNERLPVFAFGPTNVGALAEKSDDSVSGRLRLEWRPTTDVLAYAAVNRGFKSGGFNNPLTADNYKPSQMAYDPEQLDSFEVGFKSEFQGGRLRLNADAFYYDYRHFQAFRTDGLNTFLSNVDATIYGVDLEIAARVSDHLTVSGGGEWLDATAKNVTLGSGRVTDRTLANAPKAAATLSVNYVHALASGTFSADLFGRYVGVQYFDISNAPVTREGAYAVLDARIGYRLREAGPELFVSATNLFDKAYKLYAVDVASLGFSQFMYAQPRRVAVGVRWSF